MTRMHGFDLVRETDIPEYAARASLYRHARTGAELLSLSLADENKVFGVTFRTPPTDSTGVAHILEHSVLCGSTRYPVKEPFVELLKGSVHTFLNAFTYPDKTCYPVASTNARDFYNLVDVYLDAVFHPLLPEHVFRQEGWRHEPGPDGSLGRGGVVLNEMKGAYSSPDSLLAEYSQRLLFPDTPYGVDSGGDPKVIPELTYQAFLDFHRTNYHPSNARFFFSGDDDPIERLRRVDACLAGYEASPAPPPPPAQPPFAAPKSVRLPYAADSDEESGRGMMTINWLLPETSLTDEVLALEILEHALIGLSSSPLRKALIDSGLGEDLAGVGLEAELRQMYFSTGLKGIDPAEAGKVEDLVLSTLADLARVGIEAGAVEAAINAAEFSLRENNTGSFPRGLSLMLRALTTWLHGGDPIAPLRFEAPLAALKKRLASGEPVFEDMIRRYFLENPHRVTLLLEPESDLGARQAAEEEAELAAIAKGLDPAGRERIVRQAEELRLVQETPDSPEALASIPRLSPDDLPREERSIPTEERGRGGVRIFLHQLPTNGVVYLDLGLSLSAVPEDLLPLTPLFGRALLETGTAREDFVSLTRRIARKTGGIDRETFLSQVRGAPEGADTAAFLFLRGKATLENTPELLTILTDVLDSADLGNRERFAQMALEAKARSEQRLIPAGHAAAASRLRARYTRAAFAGERMHGLDNLFYLRELCRRIETDWEGVRGDLFRLRDLVVGRTGAVANLTADTACLAPATDQLEAFLAGLPEGGAAPAVWTPAAYPPAEGVAIPAQVNYVGLGCDLTKAGYVFHGSALVASRYLRMAYLWDRVRVRGGAYGAFCALDRISGPMTFVSYRDPRAAETVEVFRQAGTFLAGEDIGAEELTRAVIGAIGDMDAHLLPDAQGHAAMSRILVGDLPELRSRMRREIFETTPAHVRQFGQALAEAAKKPDIVVLGPPETLTALAVGLPGLTRTKAL